nr:hypothetical protein [Glycomyces xiaoerkulensis]
MAFVPPTVFELDSAGVGDGQGDPVDPPRLVGPAAFAQPGPCEPLDALELLGVDGLERTAVALRAAGLDLADDDGVAAPGDQVELAEAVPPVAGEQLHAVASQVRRRDPLADAAELARAHLPEVHGLGSSRARPAPNRSIGSR